MPQLIIIGCGPAGISAAIYAVRAKIDVLVIAKDIGALKKSEKIENYYGFSQPISGVDLVQNGIEQAKNLGVKFVFDEVLSVTYFDNYVVKTTENEFEAQSIIFSTGASRKVPAIKGVSEFEGKGISYCATCDAFFYKGKDVAVLGNGNYAVSEAKELASIASSVTIISNGLSVDIDIPKNIKLINKEIKEIAGSQTVECVNFKDDTQLNVSGVFIALGVASSSDLARKIGAATEKNKIIVDKDMSTNVPGLFAAGDCTGGMLQIAKAVHEGAVAATSSIKYIRSLKGA